MKLKFRLVKKIDLNKSYNYFPLICKKQISNVSNVWFDQQEAFQFEVLDKIFVQNKGINQFGEASLVIDGNTIVSVIFIRV